MTSGSVARYNRPCCAVVVVVVEVTVAEVGRLVLDTLVVVIDIAVVGGARLDQIS